MKRKVRVIVTSDGLFEVQATNKAGTWEKLATYETERAAQDRASNVLQAGRVSYEVGS